MIVLNAAVADSTSMTHGLLADFTHKIDSMMLDRIWISDVDPVTGAVDSSWWSMILPMAYPLAAIFSIILVAGMAYKMMVLKEPIDVLKLLRPIGISFVLANWWMVTFALFHLVRPVEYGFKAGYEYMDEYVDSLRNTRLELAFQISEQLKKKASEADIAQQMEDFINKDKTENLPPPDTKVIWTGKHEISVNTYGDIMNEIQPSSEEEEPDPKYNGQNIMKVATLIDNVQAIILWLAEMVWAVSLMYVFLIRNLYLAALVIFGPITIAACILEQWKDKWSEWIGRYVTVSLYGACAYVTVTMSLIIVLTALHADIFCMEKTLEDEEGIFSYIEFIVNQGLGTLSLYVITLVVGALSIPLTFEMATYAIPSHAIRSASSFHKGLFDRSQYYSKEAAKKTGKAGLFVVGAVAAGLDKVVANWMKKMAEKKLEEGAEKRSGKEEEDLSKNKDKPWMQRGIDGAQEMAENPVGPSSAYTGRTGKEEDSGRWPKWISSFFGGKESEMERLHRQARMHVLDGDIDAYLDAKAKGQEEQFLKDYGAKFAEGSFEATVAAVETNAVRCADRLTVEEGMEAQGYDGKPTSEQFEAAKMDIDAYSRAEAQGLGNEFREIRDARLNENRILLEIMTTGRASLYLFEGDKHKRDEFLKRNGLYKSYRIAEKIEKQADRMNRFDPHKIIDIKGHLMNKIDRMLLRDRFYNGVHGARMEAAEGIYHLIAERCRDILYERGITEENYGKGYNEALQRRYDIQRGFSFDGITADEQTSHLMRDGKGIDVLLKEAVQDRNIFIRFLMARATGQLAHMPWFRRFCNNGDKVSKLRKELEGLEDAVLMGEDADYIKKRLEEVEEERKRAYKEMTERRSGEVPKPVAGMDMDDEDLDSLDKPQMNEFAMKSAIWEKIRTDNASYKYIYEAVEKMERDCEMNEWEQISDEWKDEDNNKE